MTNVKMHGQAFEDRLEFKKCQPAVGGGEERRPRTPKPVALRCTAALSAARSR